MVILRNIFNENMKALGAPVPTTLFDSYQTAIGTATLLVSTLSTLGKGATMGELIGATIGLEKLAVAAAFGASLYTGIVIGSIFVASGRSASCGSRLSDMFVFTSQNKLQFKGWHSFYAHNPKILDVNNKSRRSIALLSKMYPERFEYA